MLTIVLCSKEDDNLNIKIPDVVGWGLRVKWASFNLGASQPEEYGDYYAWDKKSIKMHDILIIKA